MDDIGGRRVKKVFSATHLKRDNKHLECLKFHKNSRRNEAIHDDSLPTQLPQTLVHFFDRWYAIPRDACFSEPLQICGMRSVGQLADKVFHDEAPSSLILRRVVAVALCCDERT